MCLSPHEMKSSTIEHVIEQYKERAEEMRAQGDLVNEKWFLTKVENFLQVLKERAEAGTYDDETSGEERY